MLCYRVWPQLYKQAGGYVSGHGDLQRDDEQLQGGALLAQDHFDMYTTLFPPITILSHPIPLSPSCTILYTYPPPSSILFPYPPPLPPCTLIPHPLLSCSLIPHLYHLVPLSPTLFYLVPLSPTSTTLYPYPPPSSSIIIPNYCYLPYPLLPYTFIFPTSVPLSPTLLYPYPPPLSVVYIGTRRQ